MEVIHSIAASIIYWSFYSEKAPDILLLEAQKGTVTKSKLLFAWTGIPEMTWGNAYHDEKSCTWDKVGQIHL